MTKSYRSKILLGLTIAFGLSATASAQMMINGAGATFPYPIYSKWFDEYAKVDPSVRFNYKSIGSGGGQKQILAQTVDFGASDGPMSDENLAKAPGKLLHIPTVAGADVVAYNLPGNPALKFDADTIAGIFLGQTKKWNDAKITALNAGAKLPDQDIVVVHRSDGSGTTYIWTDYLSKISPEWKTKVGTNTSVNWPTGIGGKGNEGVAGQIKQTPGALGYVELIYAIQNKMPYADVRNSAGSFVKPTIESVTAAMATAQIPDDFTFSMTNAALPVDTTPVKLAPPSRWGDRVFEWFTLAMALVVVALVFLVGWQLARGSHLAIIRFGFHFLTTSTWDPVAEQYGALPFIYGTAVSSLIALIIAVPLSVATAVFLTELAPLWIRQPLVSLIEMLAAIPSVILGLGGLFVMIPCARAYPFPILKRLFGWTALFTGRIHGPTM